MDEYEQKTLDDLCSKYDQLVHAVGNRYLVKMQFFIGEQKYLRDVEKVLELHGINWATEETKLSAQQASSYRLCVVKQQEGTLCLCTEGFYDTPHDDWWYYHPRTNELNKYPYGAPQPEVTFDTILTKLMEIRNDH